MGAAASVQGGLYLANVAEPTAFASVLGLLAVVAGTALVAGFLTPGSGAVAGLATIAIVATWAPSPASSLLIDRMTAVVVLADAAALALLGPGAHSLDAYIFGRREIIIPQSTESGSRKALDRVMRDRLENGESSCVESKKQR